MAIQLEIAWDEFIQARQSKKHLSPTGPTNAAPSTAMAAKPKPIASTIQGCL